MTSEAAAETTEVIAPDSIGHDRLKRLMGAERISSVARSRSWAAR
jgi:hypothetical protein